MNPWPAVGASPELPPLKSDNDFPPIPEEDNDTVLISRGIETFARQHVMGLDPAHDGGEEQQERDRREESQTTAAETFH